MSKISTALRAAALGPAPRLPQYCISWVDWDAASAVQEFCSGDEWVAWRESLDDDDRRMLMILVACALESEE